MTTRGGPGRLVAVRGVADLLSHAYALRHVDAGQAVAASRRAVSIVEQLPLLTPADRDLRAQAWAILGNSYRIAGDLSEAANALEVAERQRLLGQGGPELAVQGLQFRASLAIASRRLDDADHLLARASAIADDEGLGLDHSKALVKRAIVLIYRGELEAAYRVVADGISTGEWTLELRQSACEVALSALALDQKPLRAAQLWKQVAPLFEGCGELLSLKLLWARGLIAGQLGRPQMLADVQAAYLARGMAFEAALVGLDRAFCAARSGRDREARERLEEAEPILRLYGLGSDCRTAAEIQAVRLELAASRHFPPRSC